MDKRLSGALAWGVLLLILGIPAADMAGRHATPGTDAPNVPVSASGADTAALTWQSGRAAGPETPFGPPPADENAVPDAVATAGPAIAPEPETQPAATPAADIVPAAIPQTAVPDETGPAEVPAAAPESASEPAADPEAQVATAAATEPAPADAGAIAARVREIILAEPPDAAVPPRSQASAPDAATSTEIAAVRSADVAGDSSAVVVPEPVPYPAPASSRPRQPVVVAVSRPAEPVPQITPDNAIFFRDWIGVPPPTAATGPGR